MNQNPRCRRPDWGRKMKKVNQVSCIRVGSFGGSSLKVCSSVLDISKDVNLKGRKLLVFFFSDLFFTWEMIKKKKKNHLNNLFKWFLCAILWDWVIYINGIRGCFFFIGLKLSFLLVHIPLSESAEGSLLTS